MHNMDELLLPISSDNPYGVYLKYDHVYSQIKELRREDDARLPQGVWQTEPKRANWQEVINICSHALKNKSKDLQFAVWIAEAMTVLHGFIGLHSGILLLQKLCEKFWDGIYPMIDCGNQDMSHRMAPFYFFAEKIQEKIILTPLTSPADNVSEQYNLSDWISARHNMNIKNNDGVTLKKIRRSALATPLEFFKKIDSDITDVLEGLKKLEAFLLQASEKSTPSFRSIYDHLEDIKKINTKNISAIESISSDGKGTSSEAAKTVGSQEEENSAYSNSDLPDDGSEKKEASVADAYEALQQIANFLEQEQPQSPASILVRIAGSIGKKTFQELLEINMQNGSSVMNTISELYRMLK